MVMFTIHTAIKHVPRGQTVRHEHALINDNRCRVEDDVSAFFEGGEAKVRARVPGSRFTRFLVPAFGGTTPSTDREIALVGASDVVITELGDQTELVLFTAGILHADAADFSVMVECQLKHVPPGFDFRWEKQPDSVCRLAENLISTQADEGVVLLRVATAKPGAKKPKAGVVAVLDTVNVTLHFTSAKHFINFVKAVQSSS